MTKITSIKSPSNVFDQKLLIKRLSDCSRIVQGVLRTHTRGNKCMNIL
jgi:hypothetical protein